jgi:alpha-L-fucosidase
MPIGRGHDVIDVASPRAISIVDLREDITGGGQVVARYRVDGETDGSWRTLARGTTIGFRRLHRIEPVVPRRVRLVIEDELGQSRPMIAVY